ncbi:MAG TPA: hypothetical protein DEB30_00280 [Candidatus Peribacter riflensis]|nr:hypothetical protein [Candidatus Peribacter riflensis]
MRILLITESLSAPGGWATYATNLAQGLRERGHDVMILSPESAGTPSKNPPPPPVLSHPPRPLPPPPPLLPPPPPPRRR